jgi:hypothetical protein
MEEVLQTTFTYRQNGKQDFTIKVSRDGDSFIGLGLSADGTPITPELRVSMKMEAIAEIDAVETVITGVQGMIIDLVHAHTRQQK